MQKVNAIWKEYQHKHHQHSSVFKEVKIMTLRNLHKITFILFECHRFIDKLIESFISLCYGEKVHDKKKFSCGSSKPHCESRIMTHYIRLWCVLKELHF